jgi:hypothetical protein
MPAMSSPSPSPTSAAPTASRIYHSAPVERHGITVSAVLRRVSLAVLRTRDDTFMKGEHDFERPEASVIVIMGIAPSTGCAGHQ